MIAWYFAPLAGLLGLMIGLFFFALPHWLDVREKAYQEGYVRGQQEEAALLHRMTQNIVRGKAK